MTTENLGISVTIDAELQRFEQNMKRAGRVVETSTTDMDRSTKRAAQSFGSLEARLNPAARAAQRLERDTARVQRALDKGAISADRAAKVQRQLNDQYEQAIARTRQLDSAQDQLSVSAQASSRAVLNVGTRADGASRRLGSARSSTRNFGLAAQNASFQVGDFATQIASGTSASRALAQQLPQLLGGFGLLGAAIGAAVAVAGALVPVLSGLGDNVSAAERATKALEESQEAANKTLATGSKEAGELSKEYSKLTGRARELERLNIQAALRETNEALDAQKQAVVGTLEPIRSATDELANFQRLAREQGGDDPFPIATRINEAVSQFNEGGDVLRLIERLKEIRDTFDSASPAAEQFEKRINGVIRALLADANTTEEARQRKERLKEALDALNGSTRQNTAETDDNTESQRQNTERRQSVIESLREQISLARLESKERFQQQKVIEAQNRAMEQGNLLRRREIDQIKELAGELYETRNATEEVEEAQRKTTEATRNLGVEAQSTGDIMRGALEEVGRSIQSNIADALRGAGGDLLEQAKRLATDIAAAFITQRIVIPAFIQPISGALGLSGGGGGIVGGGAAGQAAGTGGLLSNVGSAGSLLTNIGSGLTTPSISAGGLASFAPGIFGTQAASGGQAFANSLAYGTSQAPNALAGGIAAASTPLAIGGGLIGGLGAQFAFENNIGNTVGSSLGGIGAGIAAGAAFGPVGAAIGAALGAFAGGGIGSLFSDGAAGDFPFASATLGRNLSASATASSDGADAGPFRDALGGSGEQLRQIARAAGASGVSLAAPIRLGRSSGRGLLQGGYFVGGYGTRTLGSLVDPLPSNRQGLNKEEAQSLYTDLLFQSARFEGLSDDVRRILRRSIDLRDGDPNEIGQDVSLFRQFDDLYTTRDETQSSFVATLDQLSEQFESARKRASELGLATADLSARYETFRSQLIGERRVALQLEGQGLGGAGSSIVQLGRQIDVLRQERERGIIDNDTFNAVIDQRFQQAFGGVTSAQREQLIDVLEQADIELPNLATVIENLNDVSTTAADGLQDLFNVLSGGIDQLRLDTPGAREARRSDALDRLSDALDSARGGEFVSADRARAIFQDIGTLSPNAFASQVDFFRTSLTAQAQARELRRLVGEELGIDIEPRALGGPVNRGQTYLVGEQGPELFRPNTSGEIIPNDQISGGQGAELRALRAEVAQLREVVAGGFRVNNKAVTDMNKRDKRWYQDEQAAGNI